MVRRMERISKEEKKKKKKKKEKVFFDGAFGTSAGVFGFLVLCVDVFGGFGF